MNKLIRHIFIDKLGMAVSIICAIHCFTFPVILATGSIMAGSAGFFALNETFEKLMWILSFSLAFVSFKTSAFKNRYYFPILLYVLSICLFVFHKVFFPENHQILMPLVGLLLVAAHWMNFRFIQKQAQIPQ
jgi:glucan phosphoethanolaminetransferase (alkaline phosphatase superfamily)